MDKCNTMQCKVTSCYRGVMTRPRGNLYHSPSWPPVWGLIEFHRRTKHPLAPVRILPNGSSLAGTSTWVTLPDLPEVARVPSIVKPNHRDAKVLMEGRFLSLGFRVELSYRCRFSSWRFRVKSEITTTVAFQAWCVELSLIVAYIICS